MAERPAMEAGASSSRPQIYVHFEFGVSWTSKSAARNHGITYMSRSLRDVRNAQPKQLPPANTNYLSHIADFYQYGQQPRHGHAVNHGQNHARHNPYEYLNPHHQRPHPQQQLQLEYYPQQSAGVVDVTDESHRHWRRNSRSSHERGRSAPPPFNDSPWNETPEPPGPSALPRHRGYEGADIPAAGSPSRFRLGGSGMPWSADTWPLAGSSSGSGSGVDARRERDEEVVPFANRPTTVPLTPGDSYPDRDRSEDPARVHDLGALSAAMMTVDNGFEDQWWNQGPRETTVTLATVAGRLPTPPPRDAGERSLGWAIRREDQGSHGDGTVDADARIRSRQIQHEQQQELLDRRHRHHPLHQRRPSSSGASMQHPSRSDTLPPVSALSPHTPHGSASAAAAEFTGPRGTVVSPISEYSSINSVVGADGPLGHRASHASSLPSFEDRLHRSLSVRSDELWLEDKEIGN